MAIPRSLRLSLDRLENLLSQVVLLQQVPEGQDPGLIRDPVAHQVGGSEPAYGRHLDQGFFHSRIAEEIQLLQQVDSQHGGQGIRRPSVLLASFRVVGLDTVDQGLPGYDILHLCQKLFWLGAPLGGGM